MAGTGLTLIAESLELPELGSLQFIFKMRDVVFAQQNVTVCGLGLF